MIGNELLFQDDIDFNKSPHIKFLVESAKLAGIRIGKVNKNKLFLIKEGPISCLFNEKPIIFDCKDWNFWCKSDKWKNVPYFKSHHLIEGYNKNNTFPNVPIMVYPAGELNDYYEYKKKFNYKCTNNYIKNKQIPYGRATERRNKVQKILKNTFKNVDTNPKDTIKKFWEVHEHCLSAVCVPGATNNMLDRGHLELIGLGICTISPLIPTRLPYDTKLIPGIHYLCCKDDYSDLINILKWCMKHRSECETIGQNASKFFNLYLTPIKQWQWIKKITMEFYKNNE